ncbi:MAG: hypothetical protein P1R58_00695 [bacterium]|nr:hypothetical protein [bacterium]
MPTNLITLGLIMTEQEIKEQLQNFPYLRKYLSEIPSNCWSLLVPNSVTKFKEFEYTIRECWAEGEIRDSVMSVQNRFGLPLRPNLSIRETLQRLRIRKLKSRRQPGRR